MKKAYLFLPIILLSFLAFTLVLFLHFKILIIPLICLLGGIIIRLIFKTKAILIFTGIFPMASGIAFFENHGFPFNYLMLPLFLLFGIFVGDIFERKKKVIKFLDSIHSFYLLFLIFNLISSLFVILRWSNISLSLGAFFKDTPIAPTGERLSFGIFFPLLNLFVFTISYLYLIYLKEHKDKEKLILAFALGQSISIFISLSQNILNLELFSFAHFNGMACDSPTFGFLSSILLLVAWHFFPNRKKTGIFLIMVSLLGIFNSHSKIGLIAIGFLLLLIIFSLKGKSRYVAVFIIFLMSFHFIFFTYHGKFAKKSRLIKETRGIIEAIPKIIFPDIPLDRVSQKHFFAARDKTWAYSYQIIKKHPFSGVGVGNFLFWVKYHKFGGYYRHDHSNNQYLYILTAIGSIGFLVFLFYIWQIFKSQKGKSRFLLLCVLIILFFGNFFWVPESILAFWFLISLNINQPKDEFFKRKILYYLMVLSLIIFVFSEINHFSSLNPKAWAKETNTPYDYGFWYSEKDQNDSIFQWTKGKSGIYIYSDENGRSKEFRIICGAPLEHLRDKEQRIKIYWRGKLYKQVTFRENSEFRFQIKDDKHQEGFLEIRVDPVFNLKKMNISPESRDLGVQFYMFIHK